MSAPLVVAVDGPVGVGKSSVARALAERLGVPYLDTGAMYRALGLSVLERGVDPEDRDAVERLAGSVDLELRPVARGAVEILLDGQPVEGRIRDPAVADVTSRIAVYPAVRRRMVEQQRRAARRHGAVVEGRDIGTKVFPQTRFKFFLDAPPEVRARRRHAQLAGSGRDDVDFERLVAEIERRDRRDRDRADSPLTCDESYVRVETGNLDQDQVVERMVEAVRVIAGS